MAAVANDTLVVPISAVSTPLIFFEPEHAYQLSVAIYIHVAGLGITIWDVLDNLTSDYRLLTDHRIKLPTILYFSMRVSLLGYFIGRAVLLTRPVNDCEALQRLNSGFSIIFLASTKSLFTLRVCAVYGMKRTIAIGFGITCLICVGMTITIWPTFGAAHVSTTRYCVEEVNDHLLGPMLLVIAANEALLYFAIALRIFRMIPEGSSSLARRLRFMDNTGSLPKFSRALLRDSQTSFLIIVVTRIFAATAAFSFNNPMNYMFIPADLAIVNILSSRVFRNLKLNPQLEGDLSRIPTPISFASSPRRTCNNSGESSAQSTCNVISDSMTCLQTTQSAD